MSIWTCFRLKQHMQPTICSVDFVLDQYMSKQPRAPARDPDSQRRENARRESFWQDEARAIVRAEMERTGKSYKHLEALLPEVGVRSNAGAIMNRINRGNFTFAFFLQLMVAMRCEELDLVRVTRRFKESGRQTSRGAS